MKTVTPPSRHRHTRRRNRHTRAASALRSKAYRARLKEAKLALNAATATPTCYPTAEPSAPVEQQMATSGPSQTHANQG